MDVGIGSEGVHQERITGGGGEHSQLDLAVVGDHECPTGGGYECPSYGAAGLAPHRDVLKVGGVGRQAPGRGRPLVETGVDPFFRRDEGQVAVHIGGAELLEFAVFEKVFEHGV